MQIGASGTRLEVQSADSKSDRVWNWGGGGGRWRGQMEVSRRRMENRMEVVLQKLSAEPGIEIWPVVMDMMGCTEVWR